MSTKILAVFPKFLVDDVSRSLEFYSDVLGFRVADAVGSPPVFGIVDRDGVGVHFKQGTPPSRETSPTWDAYFEVDDLDALYTEVKANGAEITRPKGLLPYGREEFDVVDPDGYILCFSTEASSPASSP